MSCSTELRLQYSFKWKYMEGARAGAEIMDRSGPGAENK